MKEFKTENTINPICNNVNEITVGHQANTKNFPQVENMDMKINAHQKGKDTILSWPDVIPSAKRLNMETPQDITPMPPTRRNLQQSEEAKLQNMAENKQTTSVSKVENWIKVNEQHRQEQENCK